MDDLRTHQLLENQKKRMFAMTDIVKYATTQLELIATDDLVLPEVVALETIKQIRSKLDALNSELESE